jgi:hypothetical protein
LLPAVRALPGNSVTGHAPQVFFQAVLTKRKAASAVPAEGEYLITAMACFVCDLIPFFPVRHFQYRFSLYGNVFTGFSDSLLFETNNAKGISLNSDFSKRCNSTR